VDFIVKIVYQIEGGKTSLGRGRQRKPIRETIKKDLEIITLDKKYGIL